MQTRKAPRVLVQCPISFTGKRGDGDGILFSLSTSGCAIKESTIALALGAVLPMRVHLLSQAPPIKVDQAEVAWTAGKDFGVRFIYLEPVEQDRLHRHISDLQKTSQNIGSA